MLITHIANGSASSVNVINIDVVLACFRGPLVVDDELVLLGLQQVVKLEQLGNRVEEYNDLGFRLHF